MSRCEACSCKNFPSFTPSQEAVQRDIMIVGDIPTAIECRKGVCMSGPAVDILRETMAKVGLPIDLDHVHYTTAIKCAIPKKKGKAIPVDAIRNCQQAIRSEVEAVQPKLLLILGKTALQTFMGDTKLKTSHFEGRVLELPEFPNTIILPIKHPALIIYSPGEYKTFLPSIELAYNLYVNKEIHDVGKVTWTVINDDIMFEDFKKVIAKEFPKRSAADIETTDLDYRIAQFCVLGISFDGQHTYVFPRHMQQRCRDLWEFLKNKTKVTWHHGKYDSKVMWRRGLGDIPHDGDTIYMHYVLNEQPPHDLGNLSKIYLQAPDYKFKMNQNFKAVTVESYDSFFESLCERVAVDCAYTYQLETKLQIELDKEPTLQGLYNKLIIPAAPFLSRVERNGMLVNPEYLEEMGKGYVIRLAEIMEEVQRLADPFWLPEVYKEQSGAKTAPPTFNPGSPKQMSWMVFKRLKLKPRIKKGTGTGAEILESIEPQHPLVAKVLEHRKVQKEHSTYVIGLLKRRDIDGRVRSNFNLHITATGRLSSTEPNVQNIPSYFGVGNIRRAFRARKGYMLMEVDYSGAELRWLACLSSCPVLTKIFLDGINLHDYTATALYGPDFTKQDRMRAKAANFGIIYGREAQSFKEEFDISIGEAQSIVINWLNAYPGAKEYLLQLASAVVEGKFVETPFNRRRRFGLVTKEALHALQNEARNMPIQSTSSDTLLVASMELENKLLSQYDTRIINLIHDSVMLEVPEDPKVIRAVSQLVTSVMIEQPKKLFGYDVPFESDTDVGYTWGDLTSYNNKEHTIATKGGDIPFDTWQVDEKKKWQDQYEQPWYQNLQELNL